MSENKYIYCPTCNSPVGLHVAEEIGFLSKKASFNAGIWYCTVCYTTLAGGNKVFYLSEKDLQAKLMPARIKEFVSDILKWAADQLNDWSAKDV